MGRHRSRLLKPIKIQVPEARHRTERMGQNNLAGPTPKLTAVYEGKKGPSGQFSAQIFVSSSLYTLKSAETARSATLSLIRPTPDQADGPRWTCWLGRISGTWALHLNRSIEAPPRSLFVPFSVSVVCSATTRTGSLANGTFRLFSRIRCDGRFRRRQIGTRLRAGPT